jgi:hypothetical protein
MATKNKYSSFWIDDSYFGGDIDTAVDTNSVDVTRLVAYKRAVSNFVSIVTGLSIPVRFEERGDSYTDGKTVTISSKINETDFDPIVGLALHEGSHIKLTDFDTLTWINDCEYGKLIEGGEAFSQYWIELYKKHNPNGDVNSKWDIFQFLKGYASPKIKNLVNVIEDRRIDHYVFTNAPGYKGYYQSLYDKFFNSKQIDKGLKSSEYRDNTWDSYFFRIINFINKNRDLNALPLLRQVWNMIDLKNIGRFNNTKEVVELSVEIFKLIEDSIPANGGGKSNDSESDETQEGGQGGNGSGSGDSNNDSTDGDETNGDAEGDTPQTSEGNGMMSPRQKQLLDKAIKKQEKFLDGDVTKRKISKKDNAKIEAATEAGVESKEVGDGYNDTWRGGKTNVTVVNKLTKSLIDSGAFEYVLEQNPTGWRVEKNRVNIMKGVQLGTVLGKKLKVRSEERTLSTPRMKTGKISGRLLHELGMGNINVFEQTHIDKHKPALVHISIDASGSMGGEPFAKAQISAVAIAKAASMTNNLNVVISYRTCSGNGNSNFPLMLIAYDSRVDKFSKVTQLLPHIDATGTTPEGLCFESIMKELTKVDRGTDTYFINFSDGAPQYSNNEISYSGREAREHTAKQVKKMTDAGIKVLSYFISSGYSQHYLEYFKEMYGKTAEQITVDSLIPLAKSLNKMFE